MDDNPYKSPQVLEDHDLVEESIRAAAVRGAKRGGTLVGGMVLAVTLLYCGTLGYFAITDPPRFRYALENKTPSPGLLQVTGTALSLAVIGAGCWSAFSAARAYGRNKNRRARRSASD
jgi:hypothetical protein